MLHYIRESVQGWIAWAIVILLIIPFALWGINEYFGSGGRVIVASVNGEEISQQVFQREFFQQRERMREMLGEQFNASLFEDQIKQKALDDMINREVLVQNANNTGYRISDDFLIKTIQTFEAFQADGKFSKELYKQQLSAQGESPATFEYRMNRAIVAQQLFSGLAATPLVTQHDIDYLLKLQEQTRDIGYMVLKLDNYRKDEDATEEAIKQYYDTHNQNYMTPEMVSLQYLELNAKELVSDEQPTEDELKQFYEERANLYVTPEERRTRHILLTLDSGASKEQIDAVKAKAEELRKQIVAGADFAKLAKENSQDPGSAQQGGDIGYFGKGSLDPAYEETMFKLKVGEVSEPVLSAFGYHIIKLEEVREEKAKPFEEVKASLIAEYQQGIADRKFFELSEKLTNLAYEVPDTLQDAAGATGLQVKSTELFPRAGGPGIAANPRVTAAAFGEDVLKRGYNSEPIEIGEHHVVVIRVKDHQDGKLKTLDEVKGQIRKDIINEKAQERAKATGATIIEQLTKAEATPAAAAKIASSEWKQAGELKRTDRAIDAKIVQQAFKLQRPADGKSSFGGVELAGGDFAVLGVSKVTDGDVSKIEEAKRTALKQNLSSIRGELAFGSYLQSLKDGASIVIQQDNL